MAVGRSRRRKESLLRHVAGVIGLVVAIWTFATVCYVVLVLNDRRAAAITGSLDLVRSDRSGERVLFVGNSLTAAHGMPAMVEKLAAGSPRSNPILTVMYWRGGGTLAQAAADDRLKELLRSEPWDYVVLQEQSQIPARPELREKLMLPAAATLAGIAGQTGARTVLFATWARERGDPSGVPGDTYAAMQARIDEGYGMAASLTGAARAPVGRAWATVTRSVPEPRLWSPDGYHPTRAGTYLTACVFFAMLGGADAPESSYTGGLDPFTARWLQQIARDTVGR